MAKAETPTTTLSDLPEPPIDAIFDNLPLRKLLRIDEVCFAWKEMKPVALRRRRHLIITNDQNDLDQLLPGPYSEHQLLKLLLEKEKVRDGSSSRYSKLMESLNRHVLFIGHSQSLPTATLDRLMELMPNLTAFQLVQNNGSHQELGKVVQLLDHYRDRLEQVTIVFFGKSSNQSHAVVHQSFQNMFTSLMTSLNCMTKLRNLKLEFYAPPCCPVMIDDDKLVQYSLPDLVGRLKTLKFHTSLEFNGFDVLRNHSPDTSILKHLLLGMHNGIDVDKSVAVSSKPETLELHFPLTYLTLRKLISLGPGPVATGLRSVEIDGFFSANSKAEYKALARFARQSPHLQVLTVNLKSLSIWRFVEALASLKELLQLNIRCVPVDIHPDAVNVRQLPVLPSVKTLRLEYPALSHLNYEQLHLEKLFPSLQMVEWRSTGWRCTDCGYRIPDEMLAYNMRDQVDGAKFKTAYGKKMNECLRLARLTAFGRLPQLDYLWMNIRPLNFLILPFKDHSFTNRESLSSKTEFIDRNGNDPSQKFVFYS